MTRHAALRRLGRQNEIWEHKGISMNETPEIIGVRVSTTSIRPLSGVVQVDTATATWQFDLNEEIAHQMCTQLDRFLTQVQGAAQPAPKPGRRPQVARRTG